MSKLTYDDIKAPFLEAIERDKRCKALKKKIDAGVGNYAAASEYAGRVGDILAQTIKEYADDGTVGALDIDALIPQSLGLDHEIVAGVCMTVQTKLNKNARLGVKPQAPEFNNSRAYGIVEELKKLGEYEELSPAFFDQLANFSQNVVDESIQANGDMLNNAGVTCYVVRIAEATCCDWCAMQSGKYEYNEVSDTGNDVWRRHLGCRCTIDFVTERNTGAVVSSNRVNNYKKPKE